MLLWGTKSDGGGGKTFDDGIHPCGVDAISVWSGKYVDAIQVAYEGPKDWGRKAGGGGGGRAVFTVPSGEYINEIRIWSGNVVDAIQLVTSGGTVSPKYGGDGGRKSVEKAPEGKQLVGIEGRSGKLVDKLIPKWGEGRRSPAAVGVPIADSAPGSGSSGKRKADSPGGKVSPAEVKRVAGHLLKKAEDWTD